MEIERQRSNQRMSQVVIYGNTIYLAGQVAQAAPNAPVAAQTEAILSQIDTLLADADSHKGKLLSATIWLSNMDDFAAFNEVWDAWVADGQAPARACVEAKLASSAFNVEIMVIAAR